MDDLIRSALDIALSQEGVREEGGENRGPQVDAYLKSVGAAPGNPWCAAFVCWCIEQAAQRADEPYLFIRSAYCPDIANWARERHILMESAGPGDIFLRFGTVASEFRACHTGFVTGIAAVSFETVEGNTNIDGSCEGIGVFRRARAIADCYRFVRWSAVLTAALPYSLMIDGAGVCSLPVLDGRALCPIRVWAEKLGLPVAWNQENQTVALDGRELAAAITLIDGKGYVPIRDLAYASGLHLEVDEAARRVLISRS